MKHYYLDKDSIIHNLDPRTKILAFFMYIFFIVLSPATKNIQFLLFFLITLCLILISRVPIIYFVKNILAIFPFVCFVAIFIPFLKKGEITGSYNLGSLHLTVTSTGLLILKNILIKSILSILVLALLSATTKFQDILKATEKLKFSKVIILILSFMYRYIFVLIDEKTRIERAISSRLFGKNSLRVFNSLGNIIGTLFIRTYERSERIYIAMCSRLFDGKIKTFNELKFKQKDICFLILFSSVLVSIKLLVK